MMYCSDIKEKLASYAIGKCFAPKRKLMSGRKIMFE